MDTKLTMMEGVPVIINPWVPKPTFRLVDVPGLEPHIIADRVETVREAVKAMESARDQMFLKSCGIEGGF